MSTVRLRIRYVDGRSEDREFAQGRYRVGRDEGDIVLRDPNTSAVHADLDVEPPHARLTDAGSTNGSFDAAGNRLNGPQLLRAGEPVRLGNSAITLLAAQPAQPPKGRTQVMAQVPDASGPPPAQVQGYGPPPGQLQAYGPPPAQPQGYGPPPAQPQGYGPPPGQPQAYAPPPAQPQAYGPAPGQGGGFAPLPGGPTVAMDYALWPNRVVGYLIDYGLVVLCMSVLYGGTLVFQLFLASAATSSNSSAASAASGLASGTCCLSLTLFPLATLMIGAWNRVYLVSNRGYSIGQGVSGLRVVDANGQRLNMGPAALRLLAQLGLSMVPFGLLLDMLWPLFDERRQTLHDKAVNCFVINKPA